MSSLKELHEYELKMDQANNANDKVKLPAKSFIDFFCKARRAFGNTALCLSGICPIEEASSTQRLLLMVRLSYPHYIEL